MRIGRVTTVNTVNTVNTTTTTTTDIYCNEILLSLPSLVRAAFSLEMNNEDVHENAPPPENIINHVTANEVALQKNWVEVLGKRKRHTLLVSDQTVADEEEPHQVRGRLKWLNN